MKVYSIVCQKGGVGKTTTALALASYFTQNGKNVLAIDLDSQQNFTNTAKADAGYTILDLLKGRCDVKDAIQKTHICDLIPANADMWSFNGRADLLKGIIANIRNYDIVIIDTPPTLGHLTANAIISATDVIIPAQADIYSLQGIINLADTIRVAEQTAGKKIKIAGILLTRYAERTILSKDLKETADTIAKKMHTKVFSATIRETVTVRESQALQMSIFEYAPNSKVAEDYRNFIGELSEGKR